MTIAMGGSSLNYLMSTTTPRLVSLHVDTRRFPTPLMGVDANNRYYTIKPLVDVISTHRVERYQPPTPERFDGMLDYGRIAYGKSDIHAAYFTDATAYASANLGVNTAALSLRVRMRSGELLSYRLPTGYVFEAVEPMIIDLNNDGLEEVIAVRTDTNQQAASLAVFFPVGDELILAATTAQLPRGRWLNPVGAADFIGNGRTQIAVVNSPRVNSYLELYEFIEGQLALEQRFYGYSNHVYGTTNTRASVVVDFNQDGRTDMIIASNDLQTLSILSNREGRFTKLLDIPLRAYVASPFYLTYVTENVPLDVAVQLDNGQVAILSRHLLDW
jgi:hypothetical protein